MQTQTPNPLNFHLSGRHSASGLEAISGLGLRPAWLAPYRELSRLRHDFPVVLVEPGDGADFVRSLSDAVDTLLKDVAPRGPEGERLRRHALQLEREIRRAVAAGASGTLADLWREAAARLGARADEDAGDTLEQVLVLAGDALGASGLLQDCTPEMPARLITHAWRATQRSKAQQFHAELSRLALKLSDILRAAFNHSQAGRQAPRLRAAVGGPHQELFDFERLSRVVGKGAPVDELSATRRARLLHLLGVLESQRFYAPLEPAARAGAAEPFGFEFSDCAAAGEAYRERLGEVVELVKAMSMAELEAGGRYVEARHDAFFDAFDADALSADDLARLPDYLVCIPPTDNAAPENAQLLAMLSSGLPVKVLVQTTDLLEEASIGTGRFAFGVRSARLATAAMGLGGMFVLQSASANLYALRARIAQGLACRGPALFDVYTGPPTGAGDLPPYLHSAAAMQSRAFPAFSYDAQAGTNWATRFSLENNPQPEDDWTTETLSYADTALQRVSERCAFSLADFVLCNPRHARHFALAPRALWGAPMLPAADWLALDEAAAAQQVPYLLVANEHDALQRVIVDARVMQAARRCLLLWRRLQEHGGVHDAYVEKVLAQARSATPQASPPPGAAAAAPGDAATAGPAASSAASAPEVTVTAPEAAAHSRDDTWIETARCPSCNECKLINDRLFGYDEHQQAYIKDLSAGSYRDLVEAAEACQVAIIHPGKPRNAAEPGLDELLQRAEPFR